MIRSVGRCRIFAPSASEEIETSRLVHVKETFVLKWRRGTMIVLGTLAVVAVRPMPVNAEDFDAGKSAPQLFASNCSSCHRTPYGLAKRMNNWSLDSFLREHYTASRASADTLSAYLVGLNGSARDNLHKQSELASTNNQTNPSRSTPASDSRSLVDTLSAYLFGAGGTARHSRHKRSKSVAPTTGHTTQSILRPPEDISNRQMP
jgi:hypothetical protein